MKKILYLFTLCLVILTTSCNDDYVEIESLQVFGEEFYSGETVNVGMAVRMNDPDVADYYWECSGGSFLQRQGYTLNQWKAPKKAGVYTIKCTVTCGRAKETRQADIVVNGYFFDRFGGSTIQGWANSNSALVLRNGRLEINVNKADQSNGEVRYNFNDTKLLPPVSAKFDCGIVGGISNGNTPKYPTDPIKFNFPNQDNQCGLSITGNVPGSEITSTYYLNEVRVEWYPTTHLLESRKWSTITSGDSIEVTKGNFDAVVLFQWTRKANSETGTKQEQGWVGIPFKAPAFVYDVDITKNMSVSISEDYHIKVLVDNAQVFETADLKTWRAAHDNAPLQVKELKYRYPTKTQVFLDNVLFYDDGNFGK